MKIAIIGFGKMGQAIEKIALQNHHTIIAKIDSDKDWDEKLPQLKSTDMAFEFSTPDSVVSNITKCFQLNLPVVCGTTGWDDRLPEVIKICRDNNHTLLKSANFSIGVNVFFKLNQYLATLMNRFPQFDALLEETHHTTKLDKPSGTALQLANDILHRLDAKNNWVNEPSKNKAGLSVISHRVAGVSGIHSLKYESDIEIIEIKHTAKSREGFAGGALMAAEWLLGRKGYFTMDDLLTDMN
ncbi:MAG: 4-hydroxy-tetrahydrodipicolinate reductase [Bacteroidales bacterium]|nr:4-hydroxy-tetrahydrodipicolinate reductase [Bacteroidales bacterium]